ncbi:MAG: signal peptidase I [Planctomycetota bacterium]|nr:signal peptidase I [Planctomycetota bacterium]
MEGTPTERPRRRAAWIVAAAALAAGVGVAQSLLFSVCVVRGASMRPTLAPGERVLVYKLAADLGRGDLVVLRNPDAPDDLLVKRVVGLPSERLGAHGGRLFVGEQYLAEPYVLPGTHAGDLPPAEVPAGHYFVLGDNRAESVDSRAFGAVERRLLVGKVVLSLWAPGGGT